MLINGVKFDLRLYVVLTCAAPLRAYLSKHATRRAALMNST